jgi:hypothetical protein
MLRLVCVPYLKCLRIVKSLKQDVMWWRKLKSHYIVEIGSIYTDLAFFVLRNIPETPGTAGNFLPETL